MTVAKGLEAQVNVKMALYDTTMWLIILVVVKAAPITIGSTLQKSRLIARAQRNK